MNNLRDYDYLLTKLNKKKNEVGLEAENLYRLTDKIKEDILSLERGINIMEYNKEIKVEIINMPSQNIVSIRRKIAIEEFSILIGQVYNLLMEKGLTPIGGPMSIYHDEEFKPVDYDLEVAIPVKEKQGSTRILDGGLCAKAVLKGNYENLSYIYGYLNKWMGDNSYKISGAPYEVYLTDPSKTKEDENITEVYFPVFK